MPKMHQHTSGGRVPPGLSGGVYALPQTLATMGGLLRRRGREGEREAGRGPSYKGKGGKGREGEEMERKGREFPRSQFE